VNEALLAYAEKEGVQVIVGSTHEARVTKKEQITLPARAMNPRITELEKALRRSKYWPEVSSMDMPNSVRSGKGCEDPGQIRKLTKPFVSTKEVTS